MFQRKVGNTQHSPLGSIYPDSHGSGQWQQYSVTAAAPPRRLRQRHTDSLTLVTVEVLTHSNQTAQKAPCAVLMSTAMPSVF